MEIIYPLLVLIVFILIVLTIPVSIAGIAYLMRKSKRTKVEESIPIEATYRVPVRLNTPRKNDAVMKLAGFEFSGVLYTLGDKVYVKGIQQNQSYVYDLNTSSVNWVGTQAQNGLIQWFSLRDMTGNMLYVNVETGLFIFRIGRFFPSTREVYEKLFNLKNSIAGKG